MQSLKPLNVIDPSYAVMMGLSPKILNVLTIKFSFPFFVLPNTTVLPRIQLSEYYSNFQFKMFPSPKHLVNFCRRIRIVLTELYSG
jgi:hypothetical protein